MAVQFLGGCPKHVELDEHVEGHEDFGEQEVPSTGRTIHMCGMFTLTP